MGNKKLFTIHWKFLMLGAQPLVTCNLVSYENKSVCHGSLAHVPLSGKCLYAWERGICLFAYAITSARSLKIKTKVACVPFRCFAPNLRNKNLRAANYSGHALMRDLCVTLLLRNDLLASLNLFAPSDVTSFSTQVDWANELDFGDSALGGHFLQFYFFFWLRIIRSVLHH